jgi:hypothetical protein
MTKAAAVLSVASLTAAALALVSCRPGGGGAGGRAADPPAAAVLRPTQAPSASSLEADEPWTYDGSPGRILRTANYRLFTTQSAPVILGRLPTFLEAALVEYRSGLSTDEAAALLPNPPLKLDTFILSTRGQWERLTKQLLGRSAGPFLRIARGGYAWGGRAVLFDIGTHDTFAIAAHEGWHQYTQRTFAESLPVWMEEGIATYMEGHRWGGLSGGTPVFMGWANMERWEQLRETVEAGRVVGLGTLLESSPADLLGAGAGGSDDALRYYAQVWALVHFLREGAGGRYRASLERLVRDAAEGRMDATVSARFGPRATGLGNKLGPAVFLAYFNENLDEAASEYDEFVRMVAAPGGRAYVVAGRSPYANLPR